jgi:hypothetical protein
MTDNKSTKVLKKEEVEKGNYGKVVELPYIPIYDEEAESNAQDVTVKLPNNTKTTIIKITHSVNKELFLTSSINRSQEPRDKGLGDCTPKLRSMRRRWRSANLTSIGTISQSLQRGWTRGRRRSTTRLWRSYAFGEVAR